MTSTRVILFHLIIEFVCCRSNILLDEYLRAKVADFVFSINMPVLTSSHTLVTATPGHGLSDTKCYMAPEYQQGKFSTFSDVYAYGIVSLMVMVNNLALVYQEMVISFL